MWDENHETFQSMIQHIENYLETAEYSLEKNSREEFVCRPEKKSRRIEREEPSSDQECRRIYEVESIEGVLQRLVNFSNISIPDKVNAYHYFFVWNLS